MSKEKVRAFSLNYLDSFMMPTVEWDSEKSSEELFLLSQLSFVMLSE